jgi:hypothetical protein
MCSLYPNLSLASLATRPPEVSVTLPKPLDWITEILKVEPDDQKDTADQKAKTYAQALAFRNQRVLPLQVQQTDWPTLKRGLAFLVHSYPKSIEWATRYLILSYAMKDPAATKEALDVLQEIIIPELSATQEIRPLRILGARIFSPAQRPETPRSQRWQVA